MKDPFDRTKVVLRHLPPAISQAALMEQIDGKFAGRYKWVCFRPGKNSQMNQRHSRIYIDFKKLEDVVEFAELFDGHMFVNEKGSQFKALVEYAPSQRVPKAWSKKDGREGTIFKDPEYLEFLERLGKPVENLPSAEIQLERREAERAGGPKETLVVTPLMEFVRQKRAAKSGSQRSSTNGKISRRAGGASPSSSSPSSRRASEKRRVQTSMYVLRNNTKNSSGKDKSTYILVPRREEQLLKDKSFSVASASGTEALEEENGIETGKRRVVLLKGKEKEISNASGGSSQQQTVTTSVHGLPALKQNQRNEASGKIIRSILSNKDARQFQSNLAVCHSEQQIQTANLEKDKRPPRPPNIRPILKNLITATQLTSDSIEGVSISQPSAGVKVGDDDGGVHNARVGCGSNSLAPNGMPLSHGEIKPDVGNGSRNAEIKILGSGHVNGPHRHVGRRGTAHGFKEVDGSPNFSEGKPSKRGGPAGYGSHERQVWVQKSGSGS